MVITALLLRGKCHGLRCRHDAGFVADSCADCQTTLHSPMPRAACFPLKLMRTSIGLNLMSVTHPYAAPLMRCVLLRPAQQPKFTSEPVCTHVLSRSTGRHASMPHLHTSKAGAALDVWHFGVRNYNKCVLSTLRLISSVCHKA